MIMQKLICLENYLWFKAMNLFSKEDGAVDIVAIVVMIGIAVLVAVLFRKQLEELIKSLFDIIKGSAETAVSGTT